MSPVNGVTHFAVPKFCFTKLIVTVSPGSRVPRQCISVSSQIDDALKRHGTSNPSYRAMLVSHHPTPFFGHCGICSRRTCLMQQPVCPCSAAQRCVYAQLRPHAGPSAGQNQVAARTWTCPDVTTFPTISGPPEAAAPVLQSRIQQLVPLFSPLQAFDSLLMHLFLHLLESFPFFFGSSLVTYGFDSALRRVR